ncbi:helix-turn-helix transcriptional regulator [Clostridiaceae bacterium M8S5]|nr:helix-turn-helix transcriptional regulator [Clostridiaceae bacterium M8S5]
MTDIIICNINKYIKKKYIKQTWIAETLGVNKMNISNILNGRKRNVTLEELNSILEVLDLSFGEVSRIDFLMDSTPSKIVSEERVAYVCKADDSDMIKNKSVELILNIIDIIDVFKTANEVTHE